MSWKVANLCAERRFGSPVRKQIIMLLADKASDDGSGIWCSKGTIARQTELGDTTVKRAISGFIAEGILIESGRRACVNGYTAIYRINLEAVTQLETIHDPDKGTGARADGVQNDPRTGSAEDGGPGPERTPNHPRTIQKPPTRDSALQAEGESFEKVWTAFPEDRRRGRTACIEHFQAALAAGFQPDEIRKAVLAYAQETAGFTRSKVSFADNWFRQQRWRASVEASRAQDTATKANAESNIEEQCERMAGWVKSRSVLGVVAELGVEA
ncbi:MULTISPECIES: hypothetical protein [Paracoccus]|uniref:hypothetical protein n=1 Tax=Paracoccus TaxID=265 RepID=UPI000868FD7E|nr:MULTISPECIES: hypothetical protein [Paracoccus]ODT60061.1 MAG: hypothetical protein ABS73_06875 [Paracoccus sp. SCN 68-21]